MDAKMQKYSLLTFRILLALIMLVPGLTKLFVYKPAGVTAMLSGFGFPLPMFFAWVLILAEIGCGASVLLNYKLKYTAIPPIIILVIATFITLDLPKSATSTLFHLISASGFWLLWTHAKD